MMSKPCVISKSEALMNEVKDSLPKWEFSSSRVSNSSLVTFPCVRRLSLFPSQIPSQESSLPARTIPQSLLHCSEAEFTPSTFPPWFRGWNLYGDLTSCGACTSYGVLIHYGDCTSCGYHTSFGDLAHYGDHTTYCIWDVFSTPLIRKDYSLCLLP